MRVFISKYELRRLIIEEYQFNDRDITSIYSRKQSCDINKMYGTKLQYMLLH
jgi:hypothetical protein